MTPKAFQLWLRTMRVAGLADNDRECAEQLGVTPNWLCVLKKKGADRRTALACQALLNNLEEFDGPR